MAEVRTRKRGRTWSYIFEAGKQNGKRKVVEKGGFPDRASAYAAGAAAFTDWKHGNIGVTSGRITLSDFLKHWMQNVCRLNVRNTTFDLYERVIRKRITPYIGDMSLQDLTPAVLDNYMRRLASTGLSRNSLLSAKRLLHQAMDYAVYPAALIQSNPTNYIRIPKGAPREIVKRTIVTPDAYAALLEAHPFGSLPHIPIVLLYHTGMRIGEVLGLCWNDISFQQHTINVRRQYSYLGDLGNILTPPKTPSSLRQIPIDETLVQLLKRWKKQQIEWESFAGTTYCIIDEQPDHTLRIYSKALAPSNANRQMMVCTTPQGHPVSRSTVMQALHKADLNAHSFRHTHATVLIEAGASPKGVAHRLGHKSVSVTEDLYAHNTKKLQQSTVDVFAQIMQTNTICRQNADKSS